MKYAVIEVAAHDVRLSIVSADLSLKEAEELAEQRSRDPVSLSTTAIHMVVPAWLSKRKGYVR